MPSRTGSPSSKLTILNDLVIGSTNRYLKSILNGDSTQDKQSIKDFTQVAKDLPRQRSLVNLPRKTHVRGALSM
jgi:hypothetical protein